MRISLELNMESNLLSSLMIKESFNFCFFSDIKTESESEDTIKLLWLLSEMISSARSIAWASAEKKWSFHLKELFFIILFKMAGQAVLSLSLAPSLNI